jgi:hypothetical protein
MEWDGPTISPHRCLFIAKGNVSLTNEKSNEYHLHQETTLSTATEIQTDIKWFLIIIIIVIIILVVQEFELRTSYLLGRSHAPAQEPSNLMYETSSMSSTKSQFKLDLIVKSNQTNPY